jgi:hypothetical protein
VTYSLTEEIGADFTHQAGGDPQLVEGQPCIGDWSARREDDRAGFDGLPRPEQDVASRQRWEDVQADMPGYHYFTHLLCHGQSRYRRTPVKSARPVCSR